MGSRYEGACERERADREQRDLENNWLAKTQARGEVRIGHGRLSLSILYILFWTTPKVL